MTNILELMQHPEWLRCLPRISFYNDAVEITLLCEPHPSYYNAFWARNFPIAQLEAGIREAFDAALKHAQEEKP